VESVKMMCVIIFGRLIVKKIIEHVIIRMESAGRKK
jgi:hypothetical protein